MNGQLSDFEVISRCVNQLKAGKPLDSESDKYNLIRKVAGEAKEELCRNVVDATKAGPQSVSHSTWLVANYGGGKSQVLFEIRKALAEQRYGGYKVFVSHVDLNLPRNVTPSGFQLTVFEGASFFSDQSSAMSSDTSAVAGPQWGSGSSAENLADTGVEILSTLAGFEVPGASLITKAGLKGVMDWWVSRPGYIRKRVRAKLTDPDATELLTRWISYSLSQNDTTWKVLIEFADRLSVSGTLFRAVTHILKASQYGSIVVLVDQAEKLVETRLLTDTLTTMNDSAGNSGVNTFFVFAGTKEIELLRSEEDYGGFNRRFLDQKSCSSFHKILDGPDISAAVGNDIDRVRASLQRLRGDQPGLPIPRLNDARIAAIRRELGKTAKKERVSWPRFWRLMLDTD
jgi:hypothetical protein